MPAGVTSVLVPHDAKRGCRSPGRCGCYPGRCKSKPEYRKRRRRGLASRWKRERKRIVEHAAGSIDYPVQNVV
jgi:hypothetical protein